MPSWQVHRLCICVNTPLELWSNNYVHRAIMLDYYTCSVLVVCIKQFPLTVELHAVDGYIETDKTVACNNCS